jgi:hypothetical protein
MAGIHASEQEIRERVLRGKNEPELRAWVIGVIRERAGSNATAKARYQAILWGVKDRAIYLPDPKDTEYMASPATTLCLKGDGDGKGGDGSYCFRGGDCDDLLIAFLSACLCAGLDCALIVQFFGEEVHVIAGVKTEAGWMKVDPSYQTEVGYSYEPKSEKWIDVMTGETLCSGSPTCKPNGGVSTQAFLRARPQGEFVGVGAAPDPAAQIVEAWGEPLKTVTIELQQAVTRANNAAAQLSLARVGIGESGAPTAQEKQTLDTLNNVTKRLIAWAEDALSGRRSVAWSAQANDLAIEGRADDPYQLRVDTTGQIHAYDPKTGQEIGDGQLGLAPVAIVGLVVVGALATVAVTYGVYLSVKKTAEAYEVHEQQETYRVLSDNTTKLIQSGVDPDKAKAMIDALGKIKPVTPESQVEAKQGTFLSNLQGTVKWIVVGLGVALVAGGGFWAYQQWQIARKAA